MVLGWVVKKIIMKTLGEYLNNDDQNKLRIGIQKGDTTLRNIHLNVSAFDELDLPVQIKKVLIDTLEIKIQLKNLRTQPITVNIKGVEVLAVPRENIGKGNSFRQGSEESQDEKKAAPTKEKEKESKKKSSTEKLIAFFIKNVNVELEDIHVRVEVANTTSNHLSTIGVKMKYFLFETTDDKWRPCPVKSKLNNNFKLLEMKTLAVYWKCNTKDDKPTKDIPEQFLIEPISCEARLELNLKPEEIKFCRPVAFLKIELDKIGIQLSKQMYDDILVMVEHFEKMKSENKGSPNAHPSQHDKVRMLGTEKSGHYGGVKKKDSIVDQFERQFSEKEKSSLYEAIGFKRNEKHADLPIEYVDVKFKATFGSFSFSLISDTKEKSPILELQLNTVNACVIRRTADNAVLFQSNIGGLSVLGSPQNGITPKIVLPESEKEEDMLLVRLETNPLDKKCDTRIFVESRPLQIVYDLNSFVNVAAFLKPPSKAISEKISKTAIEKFAEVKEKFAKGLKHAVEQLYKMEICIDLEPWCIIIPHGGFYKKDEVNMLVICLGNLKVQKLNINIDQVQLLYAKEGEDWESARLARESPLHILLPISVNLLLWKTVQNGDQQSAHLNVDAHIPLLSIRLSHQRLQEILQLAKSILPTGVDNQKLKEKNTFPKSGKDKEGKSNQGTLLQVQAHFPSTIDMSIEARVEKVEIVVVESQNDPASNSLILSMTVIVMLKNQDMLAGINNLQIASAIYSERDKNKAQILDTCEMSLNWTIQDGKSTKVEISTSDFIFNISPQTIRTITGISVSVSKLWHSVFKQEKAENDTSKLRVSAGLWETDDLVNKKFWFLRKDKSHVDVQSDDIKSDKHEEQLLIKVPSIVVNFQGGVGKSTVSLLLVEASFDAEVTNWSSKLEMVSNICLEVAFYNEGMSVWESLVKPVVENGKMKMWNMQLKIMKNDDLPRVDDDRGKAPSLSNMVFNVSSSVPMKVTVTKTCLEALNSLAKAFGDANRLVAPTAEALKNGSPYVIINCTGLPVDLKLDTLFEMSHGITNGMVTLNKNESLQFFERKQANIQHRTSFIKAIQESYGKQIGFQVRKLGATITKRKVTIESFEERLYSSHKKDTLAFVCSAETQVGQTIIHLRSIVQIKNNLPGAVEVFTCLEYTSHGVIQPGETFDVPVSAQYSDFQLKPQNCE